MIINLSMPRKKIVNTYNNILFELKLNPPKSLSNKNKLLLLALSHSIILPLMPAAIDVTNLTASNPLTHTNYDMSAPTILTIGELLKQRSTLKLSLKCLKYYK